MVEALGGFDPQATYHDAAQDYEVASRDYWQHLSLRTVELLRLRPGERVLDVPCGTGPSVVAAAEAVGPGGMVVGIDYAERMLAMAQEKVAARGLANAELRWGDMTAIEPRQPPYDAVICVLGVFFVDDMAALVRSFHELVRPGGGRVAVAVFGESFCEPVRTVFVDAVQQVVPGFEVVEPWARTRDLEVLRGLFDGVAGASVTITTEEDRVPLPSAEHWWRIVMGSGLRRTVSAIGEEAAAAVRRAGDALIVARGVGEVVTESRYAISVRA